MATQYERHMQNLKNHAALLTQIAQDLLAQAEEMRVYPPPELPTPPLSTVPAPVSGPVVPTLNAPLEGFVFTPAGGYFADYRAHKENDFTYRSVPPALLTVVPREDKEVPYPRTEMHSGTKYLLLAPLHEQALGPAAGVSGAFSRAGLTLYDPSNAPDGERLRSDHGWPLFYPIGGDGKAAGRPMIVTPYGQYYTEAEVEAAQKAQYKTPEQLAAEKAKAEADWAEWDKRFQESHGARVDTTKKPDPHQLELPLEGGNGGVIDLNP